MERSFLNRLRHLFIILVIVAISILVFFRARSAPTPTTKSPTHSPTSTSTRSESPPQYSGILTTTDNPVAYYLSSEIETEQLTLQSNLPNKATTSTILETEKCSILVNGGFYTTNDTHIGLFITDDVVHSAQSNNALFNGLLYKTPDTGIGIGSALPDTTIDFGLQTGPLLIVDGVNRPLRIREDEPNRRMVAIITKQNKLYFAAFTGAENQYTGPYLEQLPQTIQDMASAEGLDISQAINLDGGAHSAFITAKVQLRELAPIGSYFCVR